MKTISLSEYEFVIEFTRRAAESFSQDRTLVTYTDDDIKCGCFLARRYNDSILVFKIDSQFEPTTFTDIYE